MVTKSVTLKTLDKASKILHSDVVSVRIVKSECVNGWGAYGRFTPDGFLMLVPVVAPGGIFEREILKPNETK